MDTPNPFLPGWSEGYEKGFRDGYRFAQLSDDEQYAQAVGETPASTPKRKPNAYAKRYGREYRRIKKAKTLKSGKMAKGYGGRRGHRRIVKEAHAAAKRGRK